MTQRQVMSFFYYLRFFLVALFSFFPFFAHSDRGNLPLLPANHSGKLLATIRTQSFVDNTEYFNKIMEGATIFGFHFLPSVTCLIAEDMGLNVGFIWEKHFGHMQPWHGIRPSLSTCYKNKETTFVVGIFSLQDYTPTLLEPLYLLRKPFMEGFHFRLGKNKSYLAGWLNWFTLLSKKEKRPETFTLHLDGGYHGTNLQKTIGCKIPFQLAIYHLGGQGIPVKDYSLFCGATGLALAFPNSFGGPIRCESYLLLNRYIKEADRPFQKGWGQLHTIDWALPFIGLSLSYWYGANFSSENMGYPLYQSIRIEDHKVIHYEKIRSLLWLSLYKSWMLYPGITIQAVCRPYYDFKNRLLEYGFSCKLSYVGHFQCTTLHDANG